MKRKSKLILLFAFIIGTLLLSFLMIASFHTYQNQKSLFIARANQKLEEALTELSYKACHNNHPINNILSIDLERKIKIRKDGKWYFPPIPAHITIQEAANRASYDIIDSQLWTLPRLDSIFRNLTNPPFLPYAFVLADSNQNILATHSRHLRHLPSRASDSIQLGLLAKHHLVAYFTYPFSYYVKKEWLHITTLGVLTGVLGILMLVLLLMIKEEKLRRETQNLFVHTLNHDLKSPLHAMDNLCSLLKHSSPVPYTSEEENYYQLLHAQINHTQQLTAGLLKNSVYVKGFALQPIPFSLSTLFRNIFKKVKLSLPPDKQVVFQLLLPENTPDKFTGDALHLERLFTNLIENAVKYSFPEVKITVQILRKRRKVTISVKDNGYGIEKSEQKHIFEPYYRARKEREHTSGFGLGLTYVQKVVQAHKGKIRLKSTIGKGSEFIIRLHDVS